MPGIDTDPDPTRFESGSTTLLTSRWNRDGLYQVPTYRISVTSL